MTKNNQKARKYDGKRIKMTKTGDRNTNGKNLFSSKVVSSIDL